jgi:hypothetical protein
VIKHQELQRLQQQQRQQQQQQVGEVLVVDCAWIRVEIWGIVLFSCLVSGSF